MSSRKKLVMVGAGRVGQLHTRSLSEFLDHRAEVAVIVDPNLGLARQLAADYGVQRVCGSLDEALHAEHLDGAVVTTPTFTHRDLAVTALDAGLAVHLEKPMAMNLSECRAIAVAAEQAGRQVQLGFMRRFDESFIEAAALLRSGPMGRPSPMLQNSAPIPPWRHNSR